MVSAKNSLSLPSAEEDREFWDKLSKLLAVTGKLIVRSSVIGETIWDRGRYESIVVGTTAGELEQSLRAACANVLASAAGRQCGLVIHSYIEPRQRGEFGNLLRESQNTGPVGTYY